MSPLQDSTLIDEMKSTFASPWLRRSAKETGAVKRKREVDIVAFFWALVLGFGVARKRTLVALQRQFELNGGKDVSKTAFNNRFNAGLVRFLATAVAHGLEQIASAATSRLRGVLSRFEDVLMLDATLITLHESLQSTWAGTRQNCPAALKLHVIYSLCKQSMLQVKTTEGKVNDRKGWRRFGPWLEGCLMMMDLGYYSGRHLALIEQNGGFFLSRLFGKSNPLVVSENRTHPGRARCLVGHRLRDIAPELDRTVIDVNVEVDFHRRPYGGRKRGRKDSCIWRVVGLRHDGEWRFYITNLDVSVRPEQLAELYRLRWQVELLFKVLRSEFNLDELPSKRPEAVMALIFAALLTLIMSQRLMLVLEPLLEDSQEINLQRFHAAFRMIAPILHYQLMKDLGLLDEDRGLIAFMFAHALEMSESARTQRAFTQSGLFREIEEAFA